MENIHTNPITQRVQDGTVYGGADLCASCRWALKRKSAMTGRTEVRCAVIAGSPVVTTKLAQCSAHLPQGQLSLHEMSEIAWIVETKGKHIGFLTPEELRRRQESQLGTAQPPRQIGF